MRPDYVSAADLHDLKIPNLRRIFTTGTHARGVRGVLPTVTYPSHTILMTGVWPARHRIYANTTFDPTDKNQGGWYWYADDVKVPELWEAVSKAGYVTGSVSWPVTVGARGIDWLVPEYWRASTPEDLKLIRALSTPGMMRELEPLVGPYETDLNNALSGDWARTRYAEAIIRRKHARFLTVHLAALDHLEHASGAFSAPSSAALEEIDRMVGTLQQAMRDQTPNAAICIVSDHGFAAIDHQLNLRVPFVRAGLITLTEGKTPGVKDWTASPWESGGPAFVVLKAPLDRSVRNAVEKLLRDLAADPANGIDRILDREEITAMGGATNAVFAVDRSPDFRWATRSTPRRYRKSSREARTVMRRRIPNDGGLTRVGHHCDSSGPRPVTNCSNSFFHVFRPPWRRVKFRFCFSTTPCSLSFTSRWWA